MLPTLVTALAALRPDPGQARSWVEREMSRPEYQRSLVERFLSWLGDLWDGLTSAASGASPLSAGVAVALLVVVVALLATVAGRIRRERAPAPARGGDVLVAREVSPEDHRAAAERARADGRFAEALVEAFRALASRSLRRGLVEPRPGLTAHELAADLSPAFPAHADALRLSAALFDLVFYGEQDAAAADVDSVLGLDEELRTARPGARATAGVPPAPGAPR
ncbi:MAG: DUF4129 domain-containing protein [Nocardioidaceae bacterium]